MRKDGTRKVIFGTARDSGSVHPAFTPSDESINPVQLKTDGKLRVQFGALHDKPVFGSVESRRELMQQFNALGSVNFTHADLSRYRGIPLSTIARDPDGLRKLLGALKLDGAADRASRLSDANIRQRHNTNI